MNGNLKSDGTRGFDYDDENQLIRVTVTNSWKSEFTYDGKFRRRIRKESTWQNSAWAQTAEVRYIYDGFLVIQERDGNNLPTLTLTRGRDLSGSLKRAGGIGGLLARTDAASGQTAYFQADGNGNVTALINSQQIIVAKYLYDPFGNILSKSGPLADSNTYRFSSKDYHQNSGLYYYGYRFYDPNLQSWLNRDPIEESGGINLYNFVGNNPLSGVDLLGLEGKGKDLPPGFHYYPPGAKSIGKGDWVPGSDLKDCKDAADERYLKRLQRNLQDDVPNACIPGVHPVIEVKHFKDFMHLTDRAAESSLVHSLDKWACYMTWDPLHMPPYLKQLVDDLSRKYEKARPKDREKK